MIPEDDDSLTGRPPRRWWHLATVDITPLRRHRDFRLLFIGRFVSFFGSMITVVAFPYQVYQLTHSVLLVGLLGVLEFAAILAVAFVGGALADARDRRSMVLLSEAALMVCSLLLAGNAAIAHPQVWLLFVVATAWGALDAIQRPSLDAMLPRLVAKDELAAAAALGSIRGTLGQVLGPALGGVLVAALGLSFTYMVDVATFVVGLACLWLMKAVPPPVGAERPSLRRVLEGLRYARSRQELLGTYFIDMIAMFFGMPMALFPAIAQGLGGPKVLGLLYAAPALGSFMFSATSGWTNRIHRHGIGVAVAAVIWGLAIIGFGFAPSLWLAVLFLAIAGAADMMSGVFRSVIWNQTIPDSLRGRLASIEMLSWSSGPALGNFEAGAVASIFNVRISIVSGGVLCVIGCVLCTLALPAFRAYDARLYHLAPDPAAGSVKREKQ
ncbi:MAG: MFS transporter [Chloroflexi bacterium]|nr:MAG: MFS transporter [Chloroflexota bacterium]